mmetsp:Transcript_4425/g.8593  ORF Transcript_4425/g.8593 Transcript_4425/m.8593 type:complete len:903 (-) Transcript_4425:80-2788(-)|eukprot:CAMPEP_0113312848 /NCGR_PEP_ID=MMETSP0010_2-20120614/9515_1 /TAXON_ID=216773 ORGANISM="Corethron hystrix, Strain 308" /NCGR_SAMPLE_ID=MMETSP0010_2 /ASSEMBLY_ACC=CAM_ASM_000155 /LENGTH=902 /DNA_ID=CAMNT_0000168757 /DNA_START=150 /DNA_END=2858 /DNA_ORIENTATION=- /assembly_acc=CAM_ASM_000155
MPSPRKSDGGGTNVRVVTRVRPLSSAEKKRGCSPAIGTLDTGGKNGPDFLEIGPEKRRFELDAVLPSQSTQAEVYERSGASRAVKQDLIKGFNTTILAYGQTGSGKTFTMGTATSQGNEDNEGVIPRAVNDVFNIAKKPSITTKVEVSYMEIYNEEIRDLLSDDETDANGRSGELRVQEFPDGTMGVANLTSRVVKNSAEVGYWMEEASKKRAVASTAMNAVSSRSHAVCTLSITITPSTLISNRDDDSSESGDESTTASENKSIASDNKSTISNGTASSREKISAKLTLVDLAGSEKIKRTGATGSRMQEGININKGLFVLGQVIAALSEKSSKNIKKYIPYRESKLTRLLQDSLGGNARTIMIACVSPADDNIEESTNTLRYAERARSIQNDAKRNVIAMAMSPAEAAALRKENQKLRFELKQALAEKNNEAKKFACSLSSLRSLSVSDTTDQNPICNGEINGISVKNQKEDIVLRLHEKCLVQESKLKKLEGELQNSRDQVSSVSKEAERWRLKLQNACSFIEDSGLVLPDLISDEVSSKPLNAVMNGSSDDAEKGLDHNLAKEPNVEEIANEKITDSEETCAIVSDDEESSVEDNSSQDERQMIFSAYVSLTASLEKFAARACENQLLLGSLCKRVHDQAEEEIAAASTEQADPSNENNTKTQEMSESKISKWETMASEFSTLVKQRCGNPGKGDDIGSEIASNTRSRLKLQRKMKSLLAKSKANDVANLGIKMEVKRQEAPLVKEITEEEKNELSIWLEKEIETSMLIREKGTRLDEQIALKCDAQCKKVCLEDDMENGEGDLSEALMEVDAEIKMRTKLIESYDKTITQYSQEENKKKYKKHFLFSEDFVDIEKWQSFTYPQNLVILSTAYEKLVFTKIEQIKLMDVISRMASGLI